MSDVSFSVLASRFQDLEDACARQRQQERNYRSATRHHALGAEKTLHLKVANTIAHFLVDGNLAIDAWSTERKTLALTRVKRGNAST
jgi:hypothetical protein